MKKNHKPAQEAFLEATRTLDRDVIVVANAGSGKTTLLTEHYFCLLAAGHEPNEILTFTFTEKAAEELKSRIFENFKRHPAFSEFSEEIQKNWIEKIRGSSIGTIHQFCFRILEDAFYSQKGKKYLIIDQASEIHLREELLDRFLQNAFDLRDAAGLALLREYGIQRMKKVVRQWMLNLQAEDEMAQPLEELPGPNEKESYYYSLLKDFGGKFLREFQEEKEKKSWITFDDLESKALTIILGDSKNMFLDQIKHILIDEFQDTSPIQIKIVEAIRARRKRSEIKLFCVGDPKQSIYRFRKVDQKLILKTENDILLHGGKKIHLTNNYRSTPAIVGLLNDYTQNAFPLAEPSVAVKETGPRQVVKIFQFDIDAKTKVEEMRALEAEWMTEQIKGRQDRGQSLKEIAVLYRSSAAIKNLVESLKKDGIPFSIHGGQNVFQQQEIVDLKNVLYFLAKPEDNLRLVGVLRSPLFFISDASLFHLDLAKKTTSLHQTLSSGEYRILLEKSFPQEIEKIAWAIGILNRLLALTQHSSASQVLRSLISHLRYGELLFELNQKLSSSLNIEQYLHWLEKIETENFPMTFQQTASLVRKLDQYGVSKTPLSDALESEDGIQLLTIHAAKGLQFKTVYLVGLHQGSPPSEEILKSYGPHRALKFYSMEQEAIRSELFEEITEIEKNEDLEEKKRLLYVALSRAEDELLIPIFPSRQNNLGHLLKEALGEKIQLYAEKIPATPLNGEGVSPSVKSKTSFIDKNIEPFLAKGLMPSRQYSVSELETYLHCPLKHHFLYREKISEVPWSLEKATDNTQLGTYLHQALHRMHQLSSKDVDEDAETIFEESLEPQSVELLKHHLKNYCESPAYHKIISADEDYSELPFLLEMSPYRVRGQIDRLIKKNNQWTLIDFKFSNQKSSVENLESTYSFQLKTYALAASRILKGSIPEVEIHLLRDSKALNFKFSEREIQEHEIKIHTLLNNMQSPHDFDKISWNISCSECVFNKKIPVCPVPLKTL